jgi:hypothetical protein
VNWRVKTNRTDLGGKNILVQLGFYLSNWQKVQLNTDLFSYKPKYLYTEKWLD